MSKRKECTKCKRTKPLSYFHRDSKSSDGFRNECKYCRQDDRHATDYKAAVKSKTVLIGNTVDTEVYYAPTTFFPTFP